MDNVMCKAMREAGRSIGARESAEIISRSVSGEATGAVLVSEREKVPTWTPRDYQSLPIGTPRRWPEGGKTVYKLWQQHDASGIPDWSPDKAVSLWDICHTTDPCLAVEYVPTQGSRGLWQPDECCIFAGRVLRNNYPNNDRSPQELPERWTDLGAVEDWR